jgi:hypothetical protein
MDERKEEIYKKSLLSLLDKYFPSFWRIGQTLTTLLFGIGVLPTSYLLYNLRNSKLNEKEKKIADSLWMFYTKKSIPWIVGFYLVSYFLNNPSYDYKEVKGEITYKENKISYSCDLGIKPEEKVDYFVNIMLLGGLLGKIRYISEEYSSLECTIKNSKKEEGVKISGNPKRLNNLVNDKRRLEELLKEYIKRKGF